MNRIAPFIWTTKQKIEQRGFLSSLFPVPPRTEETNRWFLFRRTFDLEFVPAEAVTSITVDGRYQLYVNGQSVGRGPVRCAPTAQKFDTYDLAPLLQKGRNVIAVVIHVFGIDTSWYEKVQGLWSHCFGDGGLWVQGEVIQTDLAWRCIQSDAWRSDVPQADHGLDFIECLDARKLPAGWLNPDFDDSAWDPVHILEAGGGGPEAFFGGLTIRPFPVLQPNPLPKMVEELVPAQKPFNMRSVACDMSLPIEQCIYEEQHLDLRPGTVQSNAEGWHIKTDSNEGVSLLFKFDETLTGHVCFELDAQGGEIVDVCVSEQVDGDWTPEGPVADVRIRRRPQLGIDAQVTRYVASAGKQRFERFSWQAVRWLQITIRNAVDGLHLASVGVLKTHYPVTDRAHFSCDDSTLTRLWEVGAHTLKLCAHDGWIDCPGREQRQWLGDVTVEHLAAEVAFGPSIHRLNAKYLQDAADSQRPDGLTQMFAPGNHGTNELLIPDWTLQWILTAYDHLIWSGDDVTIESIFPAIERALTWFLNLRNSHGLIDHSPHWHFMDWAGLGREHEACALNAQLAGALDAAASMAHHIDRPRVERRYRLAADQIRQALNERHWDDARGVYVDMVVATSGEQLPRVSQHSNAAMILWGHAPRSRWDRMIARITDPARLCFTAIAPVVPAGQKLDEREGVVLANTFYGHFVQCALVKAGYGDLILAMQRDRYRSMLDLGATTLWENYEPTASLCHGFSASPTYQLTTGILGLRPELPGFGRLVIAPLVTNLTAIHASLDTVHGLVKASLTRTESDLHLDIKIPHGLPFEFRAPAGWHCVTGPKEGVGGQHNWHLTSSH